MEEYNFKDQFLLSCGKYQNSSENFSAEQVSRYTIYWVRKGKGTFNIDFENYDFEDNMLFFLSPNQVFSIKYEGVLEVCKISFTSDFYCIQTHDKAVACNGVLFNNINNDPFVKPCLSDTKKLNFILECFTDEFDENKVAQHDMLQTYLKQFMIIAVRIQKEVIAIKQTVEARLFKDFNVLVEQNFKKTHTVADYAKRLALSPKSLAKNFQKVGAKSPSDVIKSRILLEAKRKLIYTPLAVKEIAYDLGYQDAAYFTRFFSKSEKISPLEYRKNNQKTQKSNYREL